MLAFMYSCTTSYKRNLILQFKKQFFKYSCYAVSDIDANKMNHTAKNDGFFKVCHSFKGTILIVSDFPSSGYFVNHVAAYSVNVLLTIATVLLNSVTLLTFCKSSQLRSKVSNILIMVQSCIDLGVGAIGNSFFSFSLLSEIRGAEHCFFKSAAWETAVLMTILSMTTLSAMNVERYLGIVHPLVHMAKVTRKRIVLYIVFVSLLVMIMFCLSLVFKQKITIFGVVVFGLHLLSLTFVYIRIYFASVSSSRMVHSEGSQPERKKQRQFLKDIKLAKTCFLVVACSLFCLLPTGVSFRARIVKGFDRVVTIIWARTFVMLNPSLNSAVFFWRNRMLRSEIQKTIKNIDSYLKTSK